MKKYEAIDLMMGEHHDSFPFRIGNRYSRLSRVYVLFRMELKRRLIFFFIQSRPIYLKVNKISVQFIAISKVCPFMHGIYLFTSVCIHDIYQYFPSRGIRILLRTIFPRGIDSLKSFPPNCHVPRRRSGKFLSFERKKNVAKKYLLLLLIRYIEN